MAIDYTALRAEILNDPAGLGYALHVAAGSDNVIAGILNLVRASITIRRDNIMPAEVLEAIDIRDFVASPPGNPTLAASWFESVTQLRAIRLLNDDGSNTAVRGNLNRILNDVQGSQARILALSNRQGSRAEQLFGRNTVITDADVGTALTPRP